MERTIYIGAGCFWCSTNYFKRVPGVLSATAGMAMGDYTDSPKTREIEGDCEVAKVIYDDTIVTLPYLLELYYELIDVTSIDCQGPDKGHHYRTGIYTVEDGDLEVVRTSFKELQGKTEGKIAMEALPLAYFEASPEDQQDYLEKHPDADCYIPQWKVDEAKDKRDPFLV